MRFLNPTLPDGVYSGHPVLDGATTDYSHEDSVKLVRLLTRYYGLIPETSSPEIEAALADIGYEAPEAPEYMEE